MMTTERAISSPTVEVRIVATGLEFPEGPIAMPDGSVLVTEIAAGTLARVSPDGTVERIAELGGGPNGAAIGPDGAAYVCNNGGSFSFHRTGDLLVFGLVAPPSYSGGSIDRVDLATGKVTKLYRECDGRPLRGPNDIVFDETGGFWFTDHGIRTERESDRTGVFYAQPDGSSIAETIFPLDSPNGIGLSPDGSRLYVAETQVGRVWYWDLDGPGQIAVGADGQYHPGKLLHGAPGYALFDSMVIDGDGWICQATLIEGGITPDRSRDRRLDCLSERAEAIRQLGILRTVEAAWKAVPDPIRRSSAGDLVSPQVIVRQWQAGESANQSRPPASAEEPQIRTSNDPSLPIRSSSGFP